MGFSSYSQVVTPAKWVNPLDLNMVYKDISHKDDIAKQNLDELQQISTQLSSIPAFGVDSEYLSKKLQKLKSDMSGLNLTNLGDYNTVAQIKGLVNDFTNNPEIKPLVERSYFKQQEEKKMADAAKEGKSYYSRGYKNLMDYYNKGEYYTDNSKLGLTPGYITPEIQKTLQDLKKNNTKEVMEVGRDGRNRTYNKVDGEAAAREWGQLINTDPQLNKYFSDVFEDEHKDINWEQKGKEFLLNAATQSQQLAQLDPINKEKHLQKYERYMRAANSPLLPDQFKDIAFQQYVQDKADDFGNSIDALDLKDIEADAFKLKAVDHINRLNEDIFKLKLKTGLSQNPGESQSAYIQRLANKAQESDLEIAQAKLNMKTEAQKEMEDVKQEDRIEIAKIKSEKDRLKDAEKLPEYTLDEVRSKYKTSSNFNTNIKSLLKDKGLDLSSIGGFNESDIEAITPDKKNGEYMVSIDTDVFGQPTLIRITAQELDNLMNGKKHNENNLETNSNKQEGTIYDGIDENGNPKFK